jgi:ketosteroid isomerase-like protein
MPDRQRVTDLITLVEAGRFADAIDAFYTDDTVMRDNLNPPTIGKVANVAREQNFQRYIAALHESRAEDVVIDGDLVVIHWILDLTGTDGVRMRFDQVAFQRWRGDRIAEERFIYDPATLSAAA